MNTNEPFGDSVGTTGEVTLRNWGVDDVLLYALAVGAGAKDPVRELNFTTENTHGIKLQVLPTYGAILGSAPWPREFNPPMHRVVHFDEEIEIFRPLPTEGSCAVALNVSQALRHRAGTVFRLVSTASERDTGLPLLRTTMGLMVLGHHGEYPDFVDREWPVIHQPPRRLSIQTLPQQALLYRLMGDRNPLHSSPDFAKEAGFGKPILHGLCTLGIATRAIVNELFDGDPDSVRSVRCKFKRAVFPGDELTMNVWGDRARAAFQVVDSAGLVLVDRGVIKGR